jgi:hypothetical protein
MLYSSETAPVQQAFRLEVESGTWRVMDVIEIVNLPLYDDFAYRMVSRKNESTQSTNKASLGP